MSTVRNVTADTIRDRLSEVSHSSGGTVAKGLTPEDWTVGASGVGTADVAGILNFRLLRVEDLTLRRVRLEAIRTQTFHYGWYFEDVTGLTFVNCFQRGGQRGISATRVTGISGTIRIDDLEAATKHVLRTIGTCSGALTVTNAGYTPVVDATGVAFTLVAA